MCGVRRDVRPNVSNQDRPVIQSVLAEKLAASILEFADRGWQAQNAGLAVCPIQAPLMSFRIVQAQGEAFDVATWTFALEFI